MIFLSCALASRFIFRNLVGTLFFFYSARPLKSWGPETVVSFASLLIRHWRGMSTPYTYVGAPFTVFPIHIEDVDLPSSNVLLCGREKIWIVVSPRNFRQLERAISRRLQTTTPCGFRMRHKVLIVTPSFLNEESIRFYVATWHGNVSQV